jgi:hypothetical protein
MSVYWLYQVSQFFHSPEGILQLTYIFPFFPGMYYDSGGPNGNYVANENREQLIQCDIGLSGVVLMLMQLNIASSECDNDILRIYDGPSPASPPLFISPCPTPVVSASSPLVFTSSTNQVFIKFTSDFASHDGGYSIQYTCTAGTTLSATSGTIYDAGGTGGQYGNNENTLTHITCPMGQGPQLSFTELDIDGSMPSCSTDSIKIITGNRVKNTYCGTLTGSSLPQMSVGSSSALILFTSDSTITRGGYSLNYECVIIASGKQPSLVCI